MIKQYILSEKEYKSLKNLIGKINHDIHVIEQNSNREHVVIENVKTIGNYAVDALKLLGSY